MPGRNHTIELKWAIVFSLAMLIWNFLEEVTGLHDSRIHILESVRVLFIIPAVMIYIFTITEKRETLQNQYITWAEIFKSGIKLTGFVVLFNPAVQYITYSLIAKGYFSNAIAYAIESEKMNNFDALLFYSLKNYIAQGMFGFMIMGLFLSFILSTLYSGNKEESQSSGI